MQIEHLILFDKIATEKSISKVAEENHLSQPALSQKMRKLEEEMDVRLFERSNKGIELTEAGRVAQKYFHHIINTYDELEEELGNLKRYSGTVRVLATPVVGQYALPCSIPKLSAKFPGYRFSLSIMTSLEAIRKVREGSGYIGFIAGTIESDIIKCKHVYNDKIHLVCAPDFYHKGEITFEELKKHALISLIDKFSIRRIVQQDMKRAGYNYGDLRVLMELDSTESVKASCMAKLGFTFLPYMAIKKELYQKQLKIVELLNFEASLDLYMIHKETASYDDVPLDIVKYFEEIAKETFC